MAYPDYDIRAADYRVIRCASRAIATTGAQSMAPLLPHCAAARETAPWVRVAAEPGCALCGDAWLKNHFGFDFAELSGEYELVEGALGTRAAVFKKTFTAPGIPLLTQFNEHFYLFFIADHVMVHPAFDVEWVPLEAWCFAERLEAWYPGRPIVYERRPIVYACTHDGLHSPFGARQWFVLADRKATQPVVVNLL